MKLSTILAVALFGISTYADTMSLIDALKYRANATKFADFLLANPDILAIYNSTTVQTVFAPTDDNFVTPLRRRDTSSQQQQLQYQYTNQLTGLEDLAPSNLPGGVIHTGLPAPQAGGTQATVSEKVAANTTTRRRNVPSTGIKILSGLGNSVNILTGDIPYCNGLIQSTDGFFTIPSPLSSTLNSTGLSTLSSLLSSANLTNTFDSSSSITSTSYTSLAGETLTITVNNGVYYVNGARIVKSDVIVGNGVAHTIDQVLVPAAPAIVYTGGSGGLRAGSLGLGLAAGVVVLGLLIL
ncbi:FAS1 domain-containing protein [Mollisia scopiformis]|uniref:FAS1 domain-containing protein n=1 Tax=Mollisia scopiformis TaxID=149040 RepID=A0A132BAY7_MOLSC|nr:FAS1 domain-containing protein [Mollisia scopiformis]KUJ08827.1 FAS1 domain-containing protein [Mollisia scopiformis]